MNIYSLLLVFILIVIIHVILELIPQFKDIEYDEGYSEPVLRAYWRKLHKKLLLLIRYKIYVRLILETQTLMLLASLTEISNFYVEERPYISSTIIAFAILFFCLFILVFQFYFVRSGDVNGRAKIVCQEMFIQLKDKPQARTYSAMQQFRRVFLVFSIIFFGFAHRIAVFIILIVIQLNYIISMFVLSPFVRLKDAIIEGMNEIFYMLFIILLFALDAEGGWSPKTIEAFMILLTVNTLLISIVMTGTLIYHKVYRLIFN